MENELKPAVCFIFFIHCINDAPLNTTHMLHILFLNPGMSFLKQGPWIGRRQWSRYFDGICFSRMWKP